MTTTGRSGRALTMAWALVPLLTAVIACVALGARLVIHATAGDSVASAPAGKERGMDDLAILLAEATALAQEPAAGTEPERRPPPDAGAAQATAAAAAAEPMAAEPVSCPTTIPELEDVAAELVQRRAELSTRESRLSLREAALAAAEGELARRAEELDGLRAQFQEQLGQLAQQDDGRIAQLVKVYETMKPKQAAEVFDRLDLDLLTRVASRMREVKMAAVLAAMDPEKARRVTVELARRRGPAPTAGG